MLELHFNCYQALSYIVGKLYDISLCLMGQKGSRESMSNESTKKVVKCLVEPSETVHPILISDQGMNKEKQC